MIIKLNQFPVNLNNATTGYKLPGMWKDFLIVASFPGKKIEKIVQKLGVCCFVEGKNTAGTVSVRAN